MSNDIHDDLTDEEKALLKRDMKYEIQQQRAREERQNLWPMVFMGMGITFLIMLPVLVYGRYKSADETWLIFASFLPGGLLILLSAGLMWDMKRSQKAKFPGENKRKRK